jgi:hypothetical protein
LLRVQHVFTTSCNCQSLIHFVLPLYRCGNGLFEYVYCLLWVLHPQKQRESAIQLYFYGLVENENMNKWLMRDNNKSNTVENKERKQECVHLEALIFDFTHYQSLKNIEIVFFLRMEIWALWGCRRL